MSLRSVLLGSVAVTGLLLGTQVTAVKAESSWSGIYFGFGGGASVATPEVNALGLSGAELNSSGSGIDYGGSGSGLSGGADVYDSASGSSEGFEMGFENAVFIGQGFIGDLDPTVYSGGGLIGGDLGPLDLGSVLEAGKAGFLGRIETGADFESNGLLFGLNASYDFSSFKQTATNSEIGGGDYLITDASGDDSSGSVSGLSQLEQSLAFGNAFTVGARAGFLAGPNSLVFVSGGYARQKVELQARYGGMFSAYADVGTASGGGMGYFSVDSGEDQWLNGFYVGGGLEQLVGDNISLKLEYRYTDLGKIETSNQIYASGGGTEEMYAGVAAEADITTHAVVATINFRF